MSEIETERLLLRRWREGGLDPYARLCANPEVMRYFPSVLTCEESEAQVGRFVRHWEERGFGLWAMEEKTTGNFIGFVGLLHNEEWRKGEAKTEVGWRLDRARWNRGLATEGARASLRYGFEGLSWSASSASRSRRTPPPGASWRSVASCSWAKRGGRAWITSGTLLIARSGRPAETRELAAEA